MADCRSLPFGTHTTETPVVCLGQSFPSDTARRAHFTERLRQHLADPAFRARPGFPQADDETILRLSDPPYYTACPNPFLEEFVRHHGRPYDPADVYEAMPYAANVTEGKTDPIYKAHNYHTKVPHKAIVPFILNYTSPGDVVLDGFCGSGMTGVAAGWCGSATTTERQIVEQRFKDDGYPAPQWGARHAVLNDLSPAASFIAANSTMPVPMKRVIDKAAKIVRAVEDELAWMYQTVHRPDGTSKHMGFGRIDYTVWSQTFSCPECLGEIVFTAVALDTATGHVRDSFGCPNCGRTLKKDDLTPRTETYYDPAIDANVSRIKFAPHALVYKVGKTRYTKAPDADDLAVLARIADLPLPPEVPTVAFPIERMYHGSRLAPKGVTHVHHLFMARTAHTLAAVWRPSRSRGCATCCCIHSSRRSGACRSSTASSPPTSATSIST